MILFDTLTTSSVRLQNGTLAVFSPVSLTDDVRNLGTTSQPRRNPVHHTNNRNVVRDMGEVKYITALDQEHHLSLDPWHKEYPNAKLIGPETLAPKREKNGNPLPFAYLFRAKEKESTRIDADFDREFDYEYVDAHANKEIVFCHKPTRTLIEADFLFNLPANEQMSKTNESPQSGFLTKLMVKINNTRGDAIWQKRFIWYALSASNRGSFNRSCAKIDKWDFDRIVPCHGDVIETGGKGVFRKVFEWHLAAARKNQ